MNIVCNIDHNYIKYCVVMLVSLLENNKGNNISIYIIASDLRKEDKQLMADLLSQYDHQLFFYDVSDDILRNCPIREGSYISVSTYFRIFLSTILPETVSKVLYLDCDLIVRKDIKALWSTDITNYALACVEDTCSNSKDENPYVRLGYSSTYSYFNAGVLLINLDYWREHKIQEQCLDYIQNNPNRLKYYDQDVLNAIVHDQKLFVSFTWNMQEGFYRRKRRIRKQVWTEIDQYLDDPSILHYLGRRKPWHAKASYPLRSEWFIYLDKTIWKGERPSMRYWAKLLIGLNTVGTFLKVDKPRYIKLKHKPD